MTTRFRRGAQQASQTVADSSARNNGRGRASSRRGATDLQAGQAANGRAARGGASAKLVFDEARPMPQKALVGIVSGKVPRPRRSTHRSKQLWAVMCDPQPQSPLLAIDYCSENPWLAILGDTGGVIAGEWATCLRIDGAPVGRASWSSSVWTSNAEADYLELCCELPQGGRIERGVLLSRADRFALLYDAVLWPSPATIEVENRIELADGVAFESTQENTEAVLRRSAKGLPSRRPAAAARLFPLALPEWRCAERAGRLWADDRHVAWSLGGQGRALFSPIWIDLDRGRSRQRLTWRRLTVGEGLRTVPDDVAVGFRLAVGQKQWIVYRALTARGNRTLLGHNLSTEMLVARFGRDGEVDPLIEIE